MATIEQIPFMSATLENAVATRVDSESPVSRTDIADYSEAEKWQSVIDHHLIEWGWHPEAIEDDGIEPPTRDTISTAIRLAEQLRDGGVPAPNMVTPDPNGGVVFGRREVFLEAGASEVVQIEELHVWEDGTTEYRRFRDSELIERRTL